MKTPARLLACAAAAILLAACSGDGLPNGTRTVSVAPGTRRTPQVLAPDSARNFASVAESRSTRITEELRTAIANELTNSGRLQHRPSGSAEAEIVIESLRHGLVEVSANIYAVNISGEATVRSPASRGTERAILSRDFASTSGYLRPLAEFEDPANYDEAAKAAVEKIALELVNSL